MNAVTLTATDLLVEPQGLDRLWSLTSKIEVPLAHVRGATIDPGAVREPKGTRGPGLGLPGRWCGTFHRDGEKIFYNVHAGDDAVVIELNDEDYTRFVLTVDHPRELVDAINAAVTG